MLVKRWLAGETTLAEEAALRDFFGSAQEELPVDLQSCLPLFGQSAEAADERSDRKLVLHTDPVHRSIRRPLRRWLGAAAGIAAAVTVAIALFLAPGRSHSGDVICFVNGVHITDPGEIAAYTREALEIASDNLRKPGETLSSELDGDPTIARVGEMLNELFIKTE